MSKLKDSKWVYIVLSLLIAVVFWLYVRKELNPPAAQTYSGIPIVFVGMDALSERGLIISEGGEQSCALTITTKLDDHKKLDADNITVSVNISNITQSGTYTFKAQDFKISYPNTVNTNDIQLDRLWPESITVTVSKQTSRTVEVKGIFAGGVAEGFQKGEFNITPSTLTISGTEEQVSKVNFAQVMLAEQNLSATFSKSMPFTLIGFDGEVVDMENISSDLDMVQVTLPVVKLKEVPLTVSLIPGGGATGGEDTVVTIEPATITVSGSEADLEGLSEISIGSIDLSNVYNGVKIIRPIQPTDELTNVSGITEATITINFHGLETRTIEASNIKFSNVPEGYVADKVTQSRQIMVRGQPDALMAVSSAQIRIVADLSVLASTSSNQTIPLGNQTIPVKVYLDAGGNVGVVGSDYNIVISISK